jgi:hypothetical protein|tara:strand:- start:491 stop:760 length:270 start_codon:yes stop_codon:yes gene_type:complete
MTKNRKILTVSNKVRSDLVKEKRVKFLTKISKKRKWTFGDMNPYFDEVYSYMPKIEATNLKDYKKKLKLEKEKHEKVDRFNVIRTSLCV